MITRACPLHQIQAWNRPLLRVRKMAKRLAGKIAVVTAAGHGIGRATAAMFAREGAKVIATDIDEAALSSIPNVSPCRLDVTDREAIREWPLRSEQSMCFLIAPASSISGTILQSSEEELE